MASILQHPAMAQAQPAAAKELPIGDSDWLMKIGFDGQFLKWTTKEGGEYQQFNPVMGAILFEQWAQAPSKGKFWHDNIKTQGKAIRIVDKNVGPQTHNPQRGPVKHEQRKRR